MAKKSESIGGYADADEYVWITADHLPHAEGAEPFRALVPRDLTFDQIDRIKLSATTTYQEIFESLAPLIREWNAMGQDPATNDWKPVPAPAEAGADAFKPLKKRVVLWLALAIRNQEWAVNEREGKAGALAPTPEPSSAVVCD